MVVLYKFIYVILIINFLISPVSSYFYDDMSELARIDISDAYYRAGLSYLENNKKDKGLELLKTSLHINIGSFYKYRILGTLKANGVKFNTAPLLKRRTVLDMQEFEDKFKHFQDSVTEAEAIKLGLYYGLEERLCYSRLAMIYNQENDFAAAMYAYRVLTNIAPGDIDYQQELMNIYLVYHFDTNAAYGILSGMRPDKNSVKDMIEYYGTWGRYYYHINEIEKSFKFYKKALDHYETSDCNSCCQPVFLYYWLSRTSHYMKKYQEGMAYLEKGLEKYPETYFLEYEKIVIYAETGRYDEALELLTTLKSRYKDKESELVLQNAWVLHIMGKNDQALDLIKQDKRLAEGDPSFLWYEIFYSAALNVDKRIVSELFRTYTKKQSELASFMGHKLEIEQSQERKNINGFSHLHGMVVTRLKKIL